MSDETNKENQELEIQTGIDRLLAFKALVSINIMGPGDCEYREGKHKTIALQKYNRVDLFLIDGDPLEIWIEAINRAEKLLIAIEAKMRWEETNPIFIERLKAKVRNSNSYQPTIN